MVVLVDLERFQLEMLLFTRLGPVHFSNVLGVVAFLANTVLCVFAFEVSKFLKLSLLIVSLKIWISHMRVIVERLVPLG
jgi:hypothetical protein